MKRYQDDFKASIVKMHREEKRSIRSLSEEYGVSPAAIHNWVKGGAYAGFILQEMVLKTTP